MMAAHTLWTLHSAARRGGVFLWVISRYRYAGTYNQTRGPGRHNCIKNDGDSFASGGANSGCERTAAVGRKIGRSSALPTPGPLDPKKAARSRKSRRYAMSVSRAARASKSAGTRHADFRTQVRNCSTRATGGAR